MARLRPVPLVAKPCECGCGDFANPGNRYIQYHQFKNKTQEHINNIKKAQFGKPRPWASESNRRRVITEETRTKMSSARKGRIMYIPSDETKRKISETLKNKNKSSWNKGIPVSEDRKKRISDTVKQRHREGVYINSYSHKNSKIELSLIPYLEPLGYISTSVQKFYVRAKGGRTRIPDFVNRQEHKIIEIFGCYWHRDRILYGGKQHETEGEVVAWYKEQGWNCKVIWEDEVENFKENPCV